MPYLMQVVDEVKRTCPNVPMSFGRARAPIDVAGYTIPEGWLVMMAVHEATSTRSSARRRPSTGALLARARREEARPDAFMPQGAGRLVQHKCAGYDFATVMMQLFAVLALRNATWTLPAQDLSMKWVVPPEYKSGLVVAWSRLAA
jgi:cytochrome P450